MEDENKTELRYDPERNEEGEITVKRNKTADFIAKIICLLLAFFIWYYAASTDTMVYEKDFYSLPITIENKTDFATFTGDEATVDITLSGSRNDISKVNPSSIKAKVIVSGVTEAGQYTFDIRYEGLPSGVTVKNASASWIQVYVGTKKEEEIPVSVEVINKASESPYEFEATPAIQSIRVSGPALTVSRIKNAVLIVDLEGKNVNESFDYNGAIILVDENGDYISSRYLELSHSYATASVKVIGERTVDIGIEFKHGFLSDKNCDITIENGGVKVRGEVSELLSAEIKIVIDEKTLLDGQPMSYDFTLPSQFECELSSVTVTVTLKNSAEKTFTIIPEVKNGNAEIDPVTVTVRGEIEYIEKLTEDDIRATVDLSGVSDGETVQVEFKFKGEFSGKVYEVYNADDPYVVVVRTA